MLLHLQNEQTFQQNHYRSFLYKSSQSVMYKYGLDFWAASTQPLVIQDIAQRDADIERHGKMYTN